MPYLVQKNTDGTMVRQWQLGEKPMVFGRGKEVDVRIEDPEMSKRHFQIEYKDSRHSLRDLNSINGTWVNEQPVAEVSLSPGDRIRAGQTILAFEKGVGTVIGELVEKRKGHETVLKEITKRMGARAPKRG